MKIFTISFKTGTVFLYIMPYNLLFLADGIIVGGRSVLKPFKPVITPAQKALMKELCCVSILSMLYLKIGVIDINIKILLVHLFIP